MCSGRAGGLGPPATARDCLVFLRPQEDKVEPGYLKVPSLTDSYVEQTSSASFLDCKSPALPLLGISGVQDAYHYMTLGK